MPEPWLICPPYRMEAEPDFTIPFRKGDVIHIPSPKFSIRDGEGRQVAHGLCRNDAETLVKLLGMYPVPYLVRLRGEVDGRPIALDVRYAPRVPDDRLLNFSLESWFNGALERMREHLGVVEDWKREEQERAFHQAARKCDGFDAFCDAQENCLDCPFLGCSSRKECAMRHSRSKDLFRYRPEELPKTEDEKRRRDECKRATKEQACRIWKWLKPGVKAWSLGQQSVVTVMATDRVTGAVDIVPRNTRRTVSTTWPDLTAQVKNDREASDA